MDYTIVSVNELLSVCLNQTHAILFIKCLNQIPNITPNLNLPKPSWIMLRFRRLEMFSKFIQSHCIALYKCTCSVMYCINADRCNVVYVKSIY